MTVEDAYEIPKHLIPQCKSIHSPKPKLKCLYFIFSSFCSSSKKHFILYLNLGVVLSGHLSFHQKEHIIN